MRILITGSSGFIGKALKYELIKLGFFLRIIHRDKKKVPESFNEKIQNFYLQDIYETKNWLEVLESIDCIVHCAGRAHIQEKEDKYSLDAYRKVNVDLTKKIAEESKKANVKRFIYLSSIGVNGTSTEISKPFEHSDKPNPTENYSISKLEGEKALFKISKDTGLEIVVIRAPLVYGPGVKGNFYRLLQIIDKGVPLPFGKIQNNRSILAIENLIDLIICCIKHPKAPGNVFLASDKDSISTVDLIKKLSKEMNKPDKLFNVPISALKLFFYILGKSKDFKKLSSSLVVNNNTGKILNWFPQLNIDKTIGGVVKWYLSNK